MKVFFCETSIRKNHILYEPAGIYIYMTLSGFRYRFGIQTITQNSIRVWRRLHCITFDHLKIRWTPNLIQRIDNNITFDITNCTSLKLFISFTYGASQGFFLC